MSDIEIPDYLPGWIKDHIELYLKDPERAHLWDASLGGGSGQLPTLLLITTGRKSGKKRPLPLIYKHVGDAYVIIASKGGAPAHPSWYLNLVAHPECEIRVGAASMEVAARTAEGDERERLWGELAEIYPPYEEYQKSAGDREIPVVVLEPTR
jgi:deazaflavin-dependent oxidoreductase (nitroreductase family)